MHYLFTLFAGAGPHPYQPIGDPANESTKNVLGEVFTEVGLPVLAVFVVICLLLLTKVTRKDFKEQ